MEGLATDPDTAALGCAAAGLACAGTDVAGDSSSCRRHWGNAADCVDEAAGKGAAAFAGEAGDGDGAAAFAGGFGVDTAAAAAPLPSVPLAAGTAAVEALSLLTGAAAAAGPGVGDTARNLRRHSGISGDVTEDGLGAGAAEGCIGDREATPRKGSGVLRGAWEVVGAATFSPASAASSSRSRCSSNARCQLFTGTAAWRDGEVAGAGAVEGAAGLAGDAFSRSFLRHSGMSAE